MANFSVVLELLDSVITGGYIIIGLVLLGVILTITYAVGDLVLGTFKKIKTQ